MPWPLPLPLPHHPLLRPLDLEQRRLVSSPFAHGGEQVPTLSASSRTTSTVFSAQLKPPTLYTLWGSPAPKVITSARLPRSDRKPAQIYLSWFNHPLSVYHPSLDIALINNQLLGQRHLLRPLSTNQSCFSGIDSSLGKPVCHFDVLCPAFLAAGSALLHPHAAQPRGLDPRCHDPPFKTTTLILIRVPPAPRVLPTSPALGYAHRSPSIPPSLYTYLPAANQH